MVTNTVSDQKLYRSSVIIPTFLLTIESWIFRIADHTVWGTRTIPGTSDCCDVMRNLLFLAYTSCPTVTVMLLPYIFCRRYIGSVSVMSQTGKVDPNHLSSVTRKPEFSHRGHSETSTAYNDKSDIPTHPHILMKRIGRCPVAPKTTYITVSRKTQVLQCTSDRCAGPSSYSCSLGRFRHKNHLARVRKTTWFGLK